MLKKIIINILLVFCVYGSIIAQNTRDVVYLKNGGIIKGQIVEQIPGQNLKIETSDGSVFVYQTSEVEKITKEQVEATSNRLNDYQEKNYVEYKSPTAAWALSFLIPGGGQFYNGQGGKGGLMLGLYAVNVGVFLFVSWPIGLCGMLITSVWSQIDAPVVADQINRQNRLSMALGNDTYLSINPTIISTVNCNTESSLVSGFNFTLSF